MRAVLILLAGILAVDTVLAAVDSRPIDAVRDKVLVRREKADSADLKVIDRFCGSALDEMLAARDISEAVDVRKAISARGGRRQFNEYSIAFAKSARKYLGTAFGEVEQWADVDKKNNTVRNLLILTAELESIELYEFGLERLGHEDLAIRYWAVKAIANTAVVEQLNSETTTDEVIRERITRGLDELVAVEESAEILGLVAEFAGQLETAEAGELLYKIADLRIKAYMDWTVDYEFADLVVLKGLAQKILSGQSEQRRARAAAEFAQLFSCVIQRYRLGADVLGAASKHYLASVIAEVETAVLGKVLGSRQDMIKNAVERGNLDMLKKEHDVLLGSVTRSGELAVKLNFDYGKDANGNAITAPKMLPVPNKN